MAAPERKGRDRRLWAWPPGILLGLVIGMAALDGVAGIAFGVAIGVVLALALGAGGGDGDADGPGELGPGKGPDRSV
ncbi:hypothetical protein [Verrucosispora sp. WMMD573]|uniref:hypothetical protein n=1 Tax=Verrucosispora sp. WMMD573 TaxID=3015149 RepID=UPI00248C2CEE|nr:hypothetical protein [Verrucosispora sp. WMMD573]WBB56596.1 hypothetical protein O7601_11290 [Verrucosispora sp. WMMD573]